MSSTINALTSGGGVAITGDTSGSLALQTNNGTTAITVDTSQKVGIGTTSPNRLLSLYATQPVFQITNVASGNTQGTIQYQVSGSTDFVLDNQGSGSGGVISFSQAGSERMRIDTSGNVGIGTSSPANKLDIQSTTGVVGRLNNTGNASDTYWEAKNTFGDVYFGLGGTGAYMYTASSIPLQFYTAGSERMRIGSDGVVMINTTTSGGSTPGQEIIYYNAGTRWGMFINDTTSTNGAYPIGFGSGGNLVGRVQTSTTATTYATSSDYRLKENIAPMTGALEAVSKLKPCTYTWKADGSNGQGFIAHELQAVVPDCVVGEKDKLDKDGKPDYQGVDTSFLVATLTAAIQELNAKVDAQAAEIQALKGVA